MELMIQRLRQIKTALKPNKIWRIVFKRPAVQIYIIKVLLQDNQLQRHVTGLGTPITDKYTGSQTYSIFTEAITNGRKKAGTPYNLYDTGEFYESMKMLVGADYFEIIADPIKEDDNLYAKFGEEIVWLNEDSISKLTIYLVNHYRSAVREVLQIN